jgi:hypothetical protein
MSATTTDNPITYATINAALRDYDLYHSDASSSTSPTARVAPPPEPHPLPRVVGAAPTWDTTHRRVPPYRPINTELDQSVRRVYQNQIERAFVTVMFTGVFIEAVCTGRSETRPEWLNGFC